ncbi:MAG: DUF2939 domain-containing protein [Luteimonas sp.]
MDTSMMKRWLVVLIAVLIALGVYVGVGPYLTVRAIREAVKTQDASALSRQVDFPALRESLKIQLNDRLIRRAGPEAQSSLLGAFGLSLAGGLIGGGVDAMVTPMGLGAMMEGRKVWKRVDDGIKPIGAPDANAQPSPEPLHDAKYRYESLSRFTATIHDDSGHPLVFVMTRDGLRWKLSDIRLPPI